jgi:hypothetical protein
VFASSACSDPNWLRLSGKTLSIDAPEGEIHEAPDGVGAGRKILLPSPPIIDGLQNIGLHSHADENSGLRRALPPGPVLAIVMS